MDAPIGILIKEYSADKVDSLFSKTLVFKHFHCKILNRDWKDFIRVAEIHSMGFSLDGKLKYIMILV